MRSLEQALYDHELIVLRVIGEWWELDLTGSDKAASVKALAETLAQLNFPLELSYLPPEEAAAIRALALEDGRIPVATFSRTHGEVRLMGPGRLDREEPWLDPTSPAEALWYRGFLYKAFDETAEGLVEFFYLPDEFYQQLHSPVAEARTIKERESLASVDAPAAFTTAVSDAVDDLTAILAMSQTTPLQEDRLEWLRPLLLNDNPDRRSLLMTLAWETDLLKKSPEGARPARPAIDWLRQSREEQLRHLADAWTQSAWNDLCHTPGLACEGSGWSNDPILARTALLDVLPRTAAWQRLDDLVTAVKETEPDFQRPEGNYETWYIRDLDSNAYIAGFTHWDLVEGRLLRFLVQGPLFWLGLVEISADQDGELFHLTPRALDWLAGVPPATEEVTVPIVVQEDTTLLVPFNAGRYQRFQAARISEADPITAGKPFTYRLTPQSLNLAREQGITPERVLQFLSEASGRPIPAGVKRAIERWAERGTEGRLENVIVLRVREEEILDKLVANPKTRPFIGERLGELAAVVATDQWQELRQAAAQLGLLLDKW